MKVEFEDVLWAKVKRHAENVGYASPEEFVQHAIEHQIDIAASPEEDRAAAKKIKGLGYLDCGRDI